MAGQHVLPPKIPGNVQARIVLLERQFHRYREASDYIEAAAAAALIAAFLEEHGDEQGARLWRRTKETQLETARGEG